MHSLFVTQRTWQPSTNSSRDRDNQGWLGEVAQGRGLMSGTGRLQGRPGQEERGKAQEGEETHDGGPVSDWPSNL